MRMILIIIFTLLACLPSASAAPLNAGLPDQLPAGIAQSPAFVEFHQEPGTFRAPLGFGFQFNGQDLTTTSAIRSMFKEQFLASIPLNTRIEVSTDSESLEVWNYPVGTRVAHWIVYDSVPTQTFEFRMSEKLSNGTWAMGSYSPATNSPDAPLLLNQYVESPEFTIHLSPSANREAGDFKFERINLQSCRNCHNGASPSNYQFERVTDAGICGFGPANTTLKQEWARRFSRQRGRHPFLRR